MSQTEPSFQELDATPVGPSGTRVQIHEHEAWTINGWWGVLAVAVCAGIIIVLSLHSAKAWISLPIVVAVVIIGSLVIVQPGQTRVVQFFGSYVGTVHKTGLSWIRPLTKHRDVSIRVRNFETNHLKVNDADGNPVEIAAIVVWQVTDTSRALFAVDDYHNFVRVQAESALRHVATTHPYDNPAESGVSLRGSTDVVAGELAKEVAERVVIAGGGGNLSGIEKYFEKSFGIPVVKVSPFSRFEYSTDITPFIPELNSPMTVALGLGMKEFIS